MASMAKAWLGVATMCVLSVGLSSERLTDADNEFIRDTTIRFSKLSRAELLNVWHSESHIRCRHQIILALDLACRFDPYRINATGHGKGRATKKPRTKLAIRDDSPNKSVDKQLSPEEIPYKISKIEAMSYLSDEKDEIRRRRRRRRPVYLQKECSLEEHDAGCRTHRSLAKDDPETLTSKTSSASGQRREGSQGGVPVKEQCSGSDCSRYSNITEDIPYKISKIEALSFLRDEKDEIRRRWRRRRPVYLQEECSLEERDVGCRTHRSLAKDDPEALTSKTSSASGQRREGSQGGVPLKEQCSGSDCSRDSNITEEIPYKISKNEAMSFMRDEKDEIRQRWRRRRPVYLQEECSLEEHDVGCRTHRSLAKDSSNPDTRNPSPLSQKDRSSEEDKRCGDVDSCSWEQYGEGCKRHPSRKNELAPFRSKKSALSFMGENQLGQGKTSGSLVGECCLDKGCFWEEFAEYCHEHPRQQTERESVCLIN